MWMQDGYAAVKAVTVALKACFILLCTALALEIRCDAAEVRINTCALRGSSNVEILALVMLPQ